MLIPIQPSMPTMPPRRRPSPPVFLIIEPYMAELIIASKGIRNIGMRLEYQSPHIPRPEVSNLLPKGIQRRATDRIDGHYASHSPNPGTQDLIPIIAITFLHVGLGINYISRLWNMTKFRLVAYLESLVVFD